VFWDGKVARGCNTGRRAAVAGLRYWALHQSVLLIVIIVIVMLLLSLSLLLVIIGKCSWMILLTRGWCSKAETGKERGGQVGKQEGEWRGQEREVKE